MPPSGPPGEPVQFFRVLTQHFLPCCQAKAEADFSVLASPGPIPEAFALFPAHIHGQPQEQRQPVPARTRWLPLPLQKQEQQLHGFLAAALGPRRAILERLVQPPLFSSPFSLPTFLPLSAMAQYQSFTAYLRWEEG